MYFAKHILMKQLLVTIGLWFIFTCSYAQDITLDKLVTKYEPYYKESHIKMGILLKVNTKHLKQRINFESNNSNNVFNIGSATKTFTAILILQELEKGHLNLSDSIAMFLDPIKNVPGNITIEQLLRHQSGLGEVVGNQKWDAYQLPHDSLVRQDVLAHIPPHQSANQGKFHYTNTNYILLGHIVEKLTDQSYFDLLRDRIFKPCNMQSTYPYVSKAIQNLVHPTDEENEQDRFNGINYKFFADYAFAAGSIASTLEDMALFYHSLYETENLLKKDTFKKMVDFKNTSYGLGIQKLTIADHTYYGHGGNNYGYAFRNYYNPQNGNLIMYYINRFRVPLKNSLLKDLFHIINEEPIQPYRTNIAQEFSNYKGHYKLEEANLEFKIFQRNEFLYFQAGTIQVPLVSYSKGQLLDTSSGIIFELSANKNLIWIQQKTKLNAKRIKE